MQMQAESLVDLVHDRSREPAEDRPEALYGGGAHLLGLGLGSDPARSRDVRIDRPHSARTSAPWGSKGTRMTAAHPCASRWTASRMPPVCS